MFAVELVNDTVSIPASELHTHNTRPLLHSYIDAKYPNRVLMDAGLVIGRYDHFRLQTGPATLTTGGRAVYQCTFAVIVFRPWVGEVIVGKVVAADAEGVTVSTGFFSCIHVPKRWMLNPSTFKNGVWIWAPVFDDDDDDDEDEQGGESEGFEMYIGAEIRCRVKSIHFTQVTNTAKGVQAVTSMQGMSNESEIQSGGSGKDTHDQHPVRKRSSSVGLQSEAVVSPAMQIVASIREDGLGLVEWWNTEEQEEEETEFLG
jgi:DNA-directed RNA polymerase III subunit RPC8